MTLVLIILVIVWAAVLIPPMIGVKNEQRDPSYRSQEAPEPLEGPPVIRNGTARWILRFLGLIDEPAAHDGEGRGGFRGIGGGGDFAGGGGGDGGGGC